MSEAIESLAIPAQTIEASAIGADPEIAGTVFEDGGDAVTTQTVGVVGVVNIVSEVTRGGVQAVETTAEGTDPEDSLAIEV